MKVWILILLMNVIPPKITMSSASVGADPANIIVRTDNLIFQSKLRIAIIACLMTGEKLSG